MRFKACTDESNMGYDCQIAAWSLQLRVCFDESNTRYDCQLLHEAYNSENVQS